MTAEITLLADQSARYVGHKQKPYNKYGLLTKCEFKMAGYWPSYWFGCLGTETESKCINSPKKKEANIKLSWLNMFGQ